MIRRGRSDHRHGEADRHLRRNTIALTATEFRLLQFFASHSGHVFSRAQLIDGAMGRDVSVEDRTIDVHITGLRKKLGNCGDWIETVRGFGYRFRDERNRRISYQSLRQIDEERRTLPTSLSTRIRPPCASTRCLTMDNPSPVPPDSRDRAASAR